MERDAILVDSQTRLRRELAVRSFFTDHDRSVHARPLADAGTADILKPWLTFIVLQQHLQPISCL